MLSLKAFILVRIRIRIPYQYSCPHKPIKEHPQSSQLFSTVSRTLFVYSFRLSLYRLLASTFAGEEVLGSFSRLREKNSSQHPHFNILYTIPKSTPRSHSTPVKAKERSEAGHTSEYSSK